MGKLDRQLDEIKGIKNVDIVWPFTEEMYLEQLRIKLKKEIDSHPDRIPLDLRNVKGAPEGLVELLFDMKEYADSRRKNLVIAYVLEDMRAALGPAKKSDSPKQKTPELPDAGEHARMVLTNQLTPIQSIHSSVRNQGTHTQILKQTLKLTASWKFRLQSANAGSQKWISKFLSIGILSACGTALLVAGYWLYIFKIAPDEFSVEPTIKTFEAQAE